MRVVAMQLGILSEAANRMLLCTILGGACFFCKQLF